jgi:hypothetical protein
MSQHRCRYISFRQYLFIEREREREEFSLLSDSVRLQQFTIFRSPMELFADAHGNVTDCSLTREQEEEEEEAGRSKQQQQAERKKVLQSHFCEIIIFSERCISLRDSMSSDGEKFTKEN